jgi:hypothetical protein
MNLQGIKDVAFRHGEKIGLGAVALFVAWSVFGHFRGGAGAAGPIGPPVSPRTAIPSKAIEPAFVRAAEPYVTEHKVASPRHDPIWPPMTERLPEVALQVKDKPRERRKAAALIVGDPRIVALTPAELAVLAPTGLSGEPCRIRVSVDPQAKDTLVFEAVSDGSWVAVEALLANENKCRVRVRVDPEGTVIGDRLVMPPRQDATLKEEELGVVLLRFKQPPLPPKTEPTRKGGLIIVWHLPTEYRIYRKSEYDEQRHLIQRIVARTAAGGAPVPPEGGPIRPLMPPGYPGGYPGAPPAPGVSPEAAAEGLEVRPRPAGLAPGPRPAGVPSGREATDYAPAAPDQYVFVDRMVESEVEYTYWVEAFVAIYPGTDAAKDLKQEVGDGNQPKAFSLRTKQKFSFAYEGGSNEEARITVFIGPRETPLSSKTFVVPIGGYVGDPPPKEGAVPAEATAGTPEATPAEGAPAPKAAEPAAEKAAGPDAEKPRIPLFVTRYVLVDVVPDAYRVVPRKRTVPVTNVDGQIVAKEVTVLCDETARQVVVRDRKNRLLVLWQERPGVKPPPPTGPVRPPAKAPGYAPEFPVRPGVYPEPPRPYPGRPAPKK